MYLPYNNNKEIYLEFIEDRCEVDTEQTFNIFAQHLQIGYLSFKTYESSTIYMHVFTQIQGALSKFKAFKL